MNNSLTVLEGSSNSHACFKEEIEGKTKRYFWKDFTNHLISILSNDREGLVFMLWGKNAQGKASLIDKNKHLVLMSAHPSPLSANKGGWFGCKHFSKANEYLEKNNNSTVNWNSLG